MKLTTNHLLLTFAFGASFLLFSCKKERQENGVTYQLKTSTPSATITARTVGSGSIQWTGGYASVVEIEFEAKSNNVEIEYKSEARQKINLFSTISNLGLITVPTGTYEDIEYEVEVGPNGTDNAIQLNGNFTNGSGVITPVQFKLNKELEIESKQMNVVITDGAKMTAVTTLNLSLITTGVTESMLTNATRAGGVIEISDTSNTEIYNIIYENLKKCGGVEVD